MQETGGFARCAARAATELAMSRAWWDAGRAIIRKCTSANVDVSATVHQTASRIRAKLQELVDDLHASHAKPVGIPPAFEWAQSSEHVYINVKFAHKLDTPVTLGCDADEVSFHDKGFTFRAECREKKKAFTLQLTLLHPIAAENCTWTMSSVGRAMITIRKATSGVWPRLLDANKRPQNMHVWWAMKEKYEKELSEFEKKQQELRRAAAAAAAEAAKNSTSSEISGAAGKPSDAADVDNLASTPLDVDGSIKRSADPEHEHGDEADHEA